MEKKVKLSGSLSIEKESVYKLNNSKMGAIMGGELDTDAARAVTGGSGTCEYTVCRIFACPQF